MTCLIVHALGQDAKSVSQVAQFYGHNGFGEDMFVVPIVMGYLDDLPADLPYLEKKLGIYGVTVEELAEDESFRNDIVDEFEDSLDCETPETTMWDNAVDNALFEKFCIPIKQRIVEACDDPNFSLAFDSIEAWLSNARVAYVRDHLLGRLSSEYDVSLDTLEESSAATAKHIVLSERDSSATTRFVVNGSRPRSTHSTLA